MSTELHDEVDKLRTWLTTNRHVDNYDAWWTEPGVVSAVQTLLAAVRPYEWTERHVTDLLYLLEVSSTGYLAELVAQDESAALVIARHSLARGSPAGDDLAEQLGRCTQHREDAIALLIEFAHDDHERTRRMALLSLARLGSDAVRALAVSAWETGDEYQRMGALSALATIGSDQLPTYLLAAEKDGREHLVQYARKCAAGLASGVEAAASPTNT